MSIYLILKDIHDPNIEIFAFFSVTVAFPFACGILISLGVHIYKSWVKTSRREERCVRVDTTRYYSRLPHSRQRDNYTACLITGMQSRRTTLLAILSIASFPFVVDFFLLLLSISPYMYI